MTTKPIRYPAVALGPLPVEAVNTALGTDLEPGLVHLSSAAHGYMAEDHPADYLACWQHLPAAIEAPSFIGQASGHTRNFELIERIARPDGFVLLIEIGLEP